MISQWSRQNCQFWLRIISRSICVWDGFNLLGAYLESGLGWGCVGLLWPMLERGGGTWEDNRLALRGGRGQLNLEVLLGLHRIFSIILKNTKLMIFTCHHHPDHCHQCNTDHPVPHTVTTRSPAEGPGTEHLPHSALTSSSWRWRGSSWIWIITILF